MTHTTHPSSNSSTPDTLAQAMQNLDIILEMAKTFASVGQIHEAVFDDVVRYLSSTKDAISRSDFE